MDTVKYIGIDPSFLGCTLSLVDCAEKRIDDSIFIKIYPTENVFERILLIEYWVRFFLFSQNNEPINIETPFINTRNGRTSADALRLYQQLIYLLHSNNFNYKELRPKEIKKAYGLAKAKKDDMKTLFFQTPFSKQINEDNFSSKQLEGLIDSVAIALTVYNLNQNIVAKKAKVKIKSINTKAKVRKRNAK